MEQTERQASRGGRRDRILRTAVKIGALLLAFSLWLYASGMKQKNAEQTFSDVSVMVRGGGAYWENPTQPIAKTTLTLRGAESVLKGLSSDGIVAYIDLSTATPGTNACEVRFELPQGVTVVGTGISTVFVRIP